MASYKPGSTTVLWAQVMASYKPGSTTVLWAQVMASDNPLLSTAFLTSSSPLDVSGLVKRFSELILLSDVL
jgi:hypothetical protein